jgi:hypothetical protein
MRRRFAAFPTLCFMKLLDLVAQSPSRELVRQCPLRLVLADDLVRCSTYLGFAEGDRLSGCSDLVRIPSQRLWVEWTDAPRQQALLEIAGVRGGPAAPARRAGVFIEAAPSGRSGVIQTFWSTAEDKLARAPLMAEFDLDSDLRVDACQSPFEGGHAGVSLSQEESIDAVLAHARFKFTPDWLSYYRSAQLSEEERNAVLRAALGSSAFDLPMLFALFLLLTAKDGAQRRPVSLEKLNRSRRLSGKFELLDHIEVTGNMQSGYAARPYAGESHNRLSRRLHHVRGHLARRGHTVYWRSPHLRGSASLGVVKSRTVALSFH